MEIEKKSSADRRVINYLRLSVTDRCNFRCVYCMPEEGVRFMPHEAILSYEEMLRIVGLATHRGIRKVRLTGGEPLLRKGFIGFLERLCKIEGLKEITLTTNGVLLKGLAAAIRDCGICRINISLDSLRPERFLKITGRDAFGIVWKGIEEAERLGFNPVKINVVAIRGLNDDEIPDFGRLTLNKPYHIRFIELMPIGEKNAWSPDKFIPIAEIRDRVESLGPLRPVKPNPYDGPAERFTLEGGQGEIGLIGAMSHHFCARCNRLRLTSEGHLRGCLFSDQEIDIKTPLRGGAADDELLALIDLSIRSKGEDRGRVGHRLRKCARQMSTIGG